ncbi:hypothetical protein ABT160_28555 [Streptomyces sp. NPDC001941]|uniref:hypothetical protein n=1 Tax=Streptomyces sp. NPDC001941 TaxID=3154659 RepID=UPI003331D928
MSTSPSALVRTCGVRIRVPETLQLALWAAHEERGIVRHSVLCELAEHLAEQCHAGVGRLLHHRPDQAVWVLWDDDPDSEPQCLALKDCANRADPHASQDSCNLYTDHPGPCGHQLDTVRPDSHRLGLVDAALTVLKEPDRHSPLALSRAAHDAALLPWDELRARRLWPRLSPADQAAVYHHISLPAGPYIGPFLAQRIVQNAPRITGLWQPGADTLRGGAEQAEQLLEALEKLPDEWRSMVLGLQRYPKTAYTARGRCEDGQARTPLDVALSAAQRDADAGRALPAPAADASSLQDRAEDRHRGGELWHVLRELPYGWQVEAIHRIHHGKSALSAIGSMTEALDRIRSYGISLGRYAAPDLDRRTPR